MESVSVYEINCNSQIVQQKKVKSCNRNMCLIILYWTVTVYTLSLLATLTFFVKGDHVYCSGVGTGKLLFCELEPENLFHINGNELKVIKRNGNEDQIIGHLSDSLAEKIVPLMRHGFLKTIKDEITGERIAATEGMWVQGGGIQIRYKCKLYGNDSYKDIGQDFTVYLNLINLQSEIKCHTFFMLILNILLKE